jgi:uncharacterized membrane protein (TIGR01666 family)
MIHHVTKFAAGNNFNNALKVTVAAVIPALLGVYWNHFEMGFAVALGAFLTYPADIPSTLKHKVNGVLVAALMVAGSNLLVNLFAPVPFILYPFLALLLFFLSIISVYGQRATMVSFSALLSVSLAFAQLNTGWAMLQHSGLMLAGGLFYLLVSLTFHYLQPHRYIELQIADCIRLTAKYLKLRGDLWNVGANREKIIEKQLALQVELNVIHENLRDIIFRNHSSSGSSNQNRRMLIVFVLLIEILELALSTSFNHAKLQEQFEDNPDVLKTYQNLAYHLAATLKRLSKSLESHEKYVADNALFDDLEKLEAVIANYREKHGDDAHEGVMMLTNMRHYAEKQIEKIRVVEKAFTLAVNPIDLKGREKDLDKFLTPQYYPVATLVENLSFRSTIFRHSLRLTVTLMVGFVLGKLLPFENVYWILLTIIVIMRPGYGLTKKRSYERIIGTVAGGLIAFGVISVVNNPVVVSVFVIVSMLLGFAFTQINYKIGATFVTMYVVFLYGILTPNVQDVIQFRILDTGVGAALAFVANYFLWPSWEFMNIRQFLEKSIQANRAYLHEISVYYVRKGDPTTAYKLARKQAFIEIGNLMTSFQRMLQEPKSKQRQVKLVYKLVELNHSLLSSTASLGTYIQTHQTTKASEAFHVVVSAVIRNLDTAIAIVNEKTIEATQDDEDIDIRFTQLKNIRTRELKESHPDDVEFQLKLQESQLVIEQLIWLTNLSQSIIKTAQAFNKS